MTPIQQAIEASGGPAKVAAALGVSVQAVCFYRDGKRRLPYEHGPAIERLCGGVVTRRELWPDDWRAVWPELAANDASAAPPSAPPAAAPHLDGEGPASPIAMLPAEDDARDAAHAQAALPGFDRRRDDVNERRSGGERRQPGGARDGG